jgi:hypothetical protein
LREPEPEGILTVGTAPITIESVKYLGRGVYEPVSRHEQMRIDDNILDTICYVTYDYHPVTTGRPQFKLAGTAFFVRVRSQSVAGLWFTFVVTAKHVIDGAKGRALGLLVNGAYGTLIHVALNTPKFYCHPSDNAVDVALAVMPVPNSLDIKALGVESF